MNGSRMPQLVQAFRLAGTRAAASCTSGLINALPASGSVLAAALARSCRHRSLPRNRPTTIGSPFGSTNNVPFGRHEGCRREAIAGRGAPEVAAKALERLKTERTHILAAAAREGQQATGPHSILSDVWTEGQGRRSR